MFKAKDSLHTVIFLSCYSIHVHEVGFFNQFCLYFSQSVSPSAQSIERHLKMSELAKAFTDFILNTNNEQAFLDAAFFSETC